MSRFVRIEERDHRGRLISEGTIELDPAEEAAEERAAVLDAFLALTRPSAQQIAEALKSLIVTVTGTEQPEAPDCER